MMAERNFHLGDILSITTGRLVSPRHMDGVHDVLDYMTGDELFTNQLPRANAECAPWLLQQHPQLADVPIPEPFGPAEVPGWLEQQVARFGEELPVQPLPVGDHTHIDPIAEMKMMRPDMPIIAVEIPDGFDG